MYNSRTISLDDQHANKTRIDHFNDCITFYNIVQIHMHVLIHTFTFAASLVRSYVLGTLLVYGLRGHGVLSTCMCCIDLLQAGIQAM